MSGQYAQQTTVSVYQSRAEIEQILDRYGADQYIYYADAEKASVGFRLNDRQYKIVLPLPRKDERRFTHHSKGPRTPEAAQKEWEQACRSRWRALALVIKAKLEAVACKISTAEKEFLAHTVMSDGRTVGEWAEPQLETMYLTGSMPPLLPMLEARKPDAA